MKVINLLVVILLMFNFMPVVTLAKDKVTLEKDHDCTSLLKIKGKDSMKGVTYVVYKNEETNEKQPAFCVEPEKPGIGTGAGDSYDVTLSMLDNEELWRILYKGFKGSTYEEWNLECQDDLYYATKTAIHCLVQKVAPNQKYEEPTRVGYGENVGFEDVLRRGRRVLEVSQELYEYGINGKEKYKEPEISIEKINEYEQSIENEKYLIQEYKVNGNRNISSYDVEILNFPDNTKILADTNIETNHMNTNVFKIIIPEKNIKENIEGQIKIDSVKIKTYPVFYAKSYNEETQSYITYISNYEEIDSSTDCFLDAYKSKIVINKQDEENNMPIEGVEFTLFNEENLELGRYITDVNGKIKIEYLKPGRYYLKETKAPKEYYKIDEAVNVELRWNEEIELNIKNKIKKGKAKISKISDTNEKIEGAEFEIYDGSGNVLERIITNENGEAQTKEYEISKYPNLIVKEVFVPDDYILDENPKVIKLKEGETVSFTFKNNKTDIEVDVEKLGKEEAKKGEEIEYQFKNIENKSNVELELFTWTDYIPIDAVRISKINTGTWNEENKYSVWYRTNKKEYQMIADNLDTRKENEIDFENIELEQGEYITEYQFRFTNVKIGFKEEKEPRLYCKILDNLENGYKFTNNTEVVGKYKTKIKTKKDSFTTIIYTPKEQEKILPRTGK